MKLQRGVERGALAVALLYAHTSAAFDPQAIEFTYELDPRPSEYEEAGLPVPDFADSVTPVIPNSSYVAALPCLGCPFSVRTWMGINDSMEIDDPTENLLLLNISLPVETQTLSLNYHEIFPAEDLYDMRDMQAIQAPAWLHKDTLEKMIGIEMFDRPFQGVGTMYDSFDFSFELTTVKHSERAPTRWTLVFELTSIGYRTWPYNGGRAQYMLDQPGQQVVLIEVSEVSGDEDLPEHRAKGDRFISNVQLIPKLAAKELIAGSDSRDVSRAKFVQTEWDSYGQEGSWRHAKNKFYWDMDRIIADTFPAWATALVVAPILYFARRRRRRIAARIASERWKHIY